jgi:hypothetical protein
VAKTTPHQATKATLAQNWAEWGIERKYWTNIQALCLAIAGHYPNSATGQETMAADLGWCRRKLQGYLAMAVKAGIVEVTPDSGFTKRRGPNGHGYWRTNTYTLRYLNRAHSDAHGPGALECAQITTPNGVVPEKRATPSSPREELGAPAARQGGEPMAGWKPDEDWQGQSFGESPLPTGVARIPPPATRLARYFDRAWREEVLSKRPRLRGTQPSHPGHATGYIKSAMLERAGLSTEHVEAYIDAFMSAVVHDEVDWKDDQMPFQRFTTWWGHNFVEDPAIAQAQVAEGRDMLAQYHAMLAEQKKL